MVTSIDGITEEDLLEFVKKVFPKFTDKDLNTLADETIMEAFSESDFEDDSSDKLIIDENYKEEEKTICEEQHLDLSNSGENSSQYYFLAFIEKNNLVSINLSNSCGVVENEEEILNLLKTEMINLKHLDISYIKFKNSTYPSKQAFAKVFWQHVANYTIYLWPKLETITAYGLPLTSQINTLKIAQKVQSINTTMSSAKIANTTLKRMPERTAKLSNLCGRWSDLISDSKTQYTSVHFPVDNEFVSVPSYLDVDVDSIEGRVAASITKILNSSPLDVAIAIIFPFFVAKSRQKGRVHTIEEVKLLVLLCQRAFQSGLDIKYPVQIEFFLKELIDHKEAISTLFNEFDQNGHNIFTRCLGNGGSREKNLLARIEKNET